MSRGNQFNENFAILDVYHNSGMHLLYVLDLFTTNVFDIGVYYVVIFGEVLLQWFYERLFGWPYIFQNIQSFTYMYEMLFFFLQDNIFQRWKNLPTLLSHVIALDEMVD